MSAAVRLGMNTSHYEDTCVSVRKTSSWILVRARYGVEVYNEIR
jgi:hypothetical protein